MGVLKVIEVLANSSKGWEDAAQNAVKHASKTIKDIKSVFVDSQSCVVEDGKITSYRVNAKITFEVND